MLTVTKWLSSESMHDHKFWPSEVANDKVQATHATVRQESTLVESTPL